jgi:hypothetical protein
LADHVLREDFSRKGAKRYRVSKGLSLRLCGRRFSSNPTVTEEYAYYVRSTSQKRSRLENETKREKTRHRKLGLNSQNAFLAELLQPGTKQNRARLAPDK